MITVREFTDIVGKQTGLNRFYRVSILVNYSKTSRDKVALSVLRDITERTSLISTSVRKIELPDWNYKGFIVTDNETALTIIENTVTVLPFIAKFDTSHFEHNGVKYTKLVLRQEEKYYIY